MMKRSLSTAASSFYSSSVVYSLLRRNPRSVDSCIINLHSSRSLSSNCSESFEHGDNVKDLGREGDLVGTQKKIKVPESYSHRFRRKKVLSVTNIVAWEWCGKQAEFKLHFGKPKDTTPMEEGRARHRQLAKEKDSQYFHHIGGQASKKVVKNGKKVSADYYWAFKFLKFIICANQLASKGLTREMPIVSETIRFVALLKMAFKQPIPFILTNFVPFGKLRTGVFEDKFIVGIIDEIRMPAVTETIQNPSLVEIKTRAKDTPPPESQKRNGRLQLMCYKYSWDNAVTNNFPTDQFFNYFELNPGYILTQKHQDVAARNGCPAKTLRELVEVYKSKCRTLPRAHNQLTLRYEHQEDKSLIGEVHFTYDSDWLKDQIKGYVKFRSGEQEAKGVSKEELRKCDTCNFAAKCRWKINTNSDH